MATTDTTTTNPIQPRPEQVDALTDLTRAFAVHDRAQLVMACGTGKTFVGRWHAEACEAQRVVVFVPSLPLLAQTLGEWRRVHGWPFEALVICSDPTTAAGAAERRSDDGAMADVDRPYWSRARAKVTTSAAEAAKFLARKVEGRPQVVFSTYHSTPVVAEALRTSGAVFDLGIFDEAHRLAGRPRPEFRMALDRRAIVARKRLFMTATPYSTDDDGAICMDDAGLFGPVAHTVTFGEAIDAGLLSDYQVLVVAEKEGGQAARHRDNDDVAASLLDAVDRHGIRRMITFHSRVDRAAAFAEACDVVHTPERNFIRARVVHGRQSTAERADTLRWLGQDQPYQVRVVSNARCLTEGVDVPAVDAVMFADQRTSVVDIIQAIGRVLRPSPGKKRGSIIIPVALPPDGDDDTNLTISAFANVWAVLRGLRAHDQRLAEELDRAVRESGEPGTRRGRRRRPTDRVQFVLPDGVDEDVVQLRLVQEVGSAWERYYAATIDWAFRNPGSRLGRSQQHQGASIGEWAYKQRQARTRGVLPAQRIARLEEIPGWYWSREDADWTDTWELLQAYAHVYDTVADNTTGESKFANANSKGMQRTKLGVWMAAQRQLYRDEMLGDERARMLEKLPGWDWSAGLRDIDVRMVQALRLFAEFEKHVDVPLDHVEEGLPLGRWVRAVRRANLYGQIPPALADEIAAASPRTHKGSSLWRWDKIETQWQLSYEALTAFVTREGKLPTGRHWEMAAGLDVKIGMWVARQRFLHRRGELDARYVALLEQVPGWVWEKPLTEVEYGEPIDLGGWPHGTAKGIQNKCPCKLCLQQRRANDREYLAKRRELVDPVDARRARAHIARLQDAGIKRGAIVAASKVPLGVIRKVASGECPQMELNHERMLLETTVEACQASASTRVGSRGRAASLDHDKIDAAETHRLLADLDSRGFGNGWVARELGYAGGLQLRPDTIRRRIADQIADLYRRVGDLSYPRTHRNARKAPPLAELLRNR